MWEIKRKAASEYVTESEAEDPDPPVYGGSVTTDNAS